MSLLSEEERNYRASWWRKKLFREPDWFVVNLADSSSKNSELASNFACSGSSFGEENGNNFEVFPIVPTLDILLERSFGACHKRREEEDVNKFF